MTRVWGEDLSGRSFSRLTVIREFDRAKGRRQWECRCECGNFVIVGHRALKSGSTCSCGCLRREVSAKRMTSHGCAIRGRKSRLYKTWGGMIARCQIETATGYQNYGGRGISVCERWRVFENFASDMGDPPDATFTIERIDNNGNYEPGNCRWATRLEQGENKRNNRIIEHNGKKMTVTNWARCLGISLATLLEALSKHPLDVALRDRHEKA